MKFHATPREDRRTNVEQRRPGNLDSRIEEVLDCREHFDAVAQPLADVAIELEEGVERELIQIVIELAVGSARLRPARPSPGKTLTRLPGELVVSHLWELPTDQRPARRKTRHTPPH